ncbi:DUF2459 domain-containing protein [Hymenobacter sp. BT730]|uniref:DUF2459 domain-containing protein n=1 Tax=Hymenobacter sp. BT730 TaxID=3063332 RepID=UPI0026DFB381|nr:DUF2459 domain-containing protein [Hymenobacter sp. BT730]
MTAALAFLLFLLTGTVVPRNRHFSQTPDGIPLYVVSNGFHTEVMVPLREPRTQRDWLLTLQDTALSRRFSHYQYISFGWGNEGFYRASYGGRFPGPNIILRALLPAPALVHVSFYPSAPPAARRVVGLHLSEEQYRRLCSQLLTAFQLAGPTQPIRSTAPGYTTHDIFFQGTGRYHAFRTCNDWTNRSLATAGVRTAWKAPFAFSVLFQVRRAR